MSMKTKYSDLFCRCDEKDKKRQCQLQRRSCKAPSAEEQNERLTKPKIN